MNKYSKFLKERLNAIIKKMSKMPELFVKQPGKNFTRDRKLTFETVVHLLLSMGGGNLSNELLKYNGYALDTATSSAFVQQRTKLSSSTFPFLLNEFTNSYEHIKRYRGYRLLASDGSDLNIALNSEDKDTYFQSTPDSKGFNQLHLNALYDLPNKLYTDAIVQPAKKENEYRALTELVDRSLINEKVILIADRGYESYNVFAHADQKGWKYLIRVKDIHSNGIASKLILPKEDEFDTCITLILTRKQTKEVKAHPEIYRFLPSSSTFDFLDSNKNMFYPLSFRVVRFKISEDTYETIITNLDSSDFPPQEIKKLYHTRWGIETSFRELKHTIGLTCFHSQQTEYITMEIFAKLVMYNFCEMITLNVVIKQKPTKHGYQANFTTAIRICIYFFRCRDDVTAPDVEALIQKYILPVRTNRKYPRKVKSKSYVSFIYRVA